MVDDWKYLKAIVETRKNCECNPAKATAKAKLYTDADGWPSYKTIIRCARCGKPYKVTITAGKAE